MRAGVSLPSFISSLSAGSAFACALTAIKKRSAAMPPAGFDRVSLIATFFTNSGKNKFVFGLERFKPRSYACFLVRVAAKRQSACLRGRRNEVLQTAFAWAERLDVVALMRSVVRAHGH